MRENRYSILHGIPTEKKTTEKTKMILKSIFFRYIYFSFILLLLLKNNYICIVTIK